MTTDKFTQERRTQQYIKEIIKRGKEDFPANERGDVILMLSSSGIYEPYVYSDLLKNVSRKYFPEGLEFLVGSTVHVTGDSDINYYAPHMERDLRIKYKEVIAFPITITKRWSGALGNITTKVTISSKRDFDERVKMHLNAYEWRYFVRQRHDRTPSYIWVPHQAYADEFKEVLRILVPDESKRKPIEEKLAAYYLRDTTHM